MRMNSFLTGVPIDSASQETFAFIFGRVVRIDFEPEEIHDYHHEWCVELILSGYNQNSTFEINQSIRSSQTPVFKF